MLRISIGSCSEMGIFRYHNFVMKGEENDLGCFDIDRYTHSMW